MLTWQKERMFAELKNFTEVVEAATVGDDTIELRVDAQALGDTRFRKHYLVINGTWDNTSRRNYRAAKEEFDATVAYLTPDGVAA